MVLWWGICGMIIPLTCLGQSWFTPAALASSLVTLKNVVVWMINCLANLGMHLNLCTECIFSILCKRFSDYVRPIHRNMEKLGRRQHGDGILGRKLDIIYTERTLDIVLNGCEVLDRLCPEDGWWDPPNACICFRLGIFHTTGPCNISADPPNLLWGGRSWNIVPGLSLMEKKKKNQVNRKYTNVPLWWEAERVQIQSASPTEVHKGKITRCLSSCC